MCIMREETLVSAAEQSLSKLQTTSQNAISFILSTIFFTVEKLFGNLLLTFDTLAPKERTSPSEQIENELKTHALHNLMYLIIGDKRSKFADFLTSNLETFYSTILTTTTQIITQDPIIEHALAWVHLLAYLKLDQVIFHGLEISKNLTRYLLRKSVLSNSWNGKLVYASCFLSTCQLLVSTSSKNVVKSLLTYATKNPSYVEDILYVHLIFFLTI